MTTSISPGKKLRDTIATGETLLMPGCVDPLSARIFEGMGFKALSVGGWMTGAEMATPEALLTMTEQVNVARRVAQAVDIPVRADMHTGFGEPVHVMRAVREFEEAGLAGVHLEDQVFPKRASYHRGLEHVVSLDDFKRRLEWALKARTDDNFMIMARTDAGNAYEGSWKEAARRAKAAKEMGIEWLLPHTRTKQEIEKFRQEYTEDDMILESSSYFNGLTPQQFREYGFQAISYPLATVIAQQAATIKLYRSLQETGVAPMDAEWAKEVRETIENAQGMENFWAVERQTVEADASHEGRTIVGYEGQDVPASS
jgi:methylisocitrate lyase